MQARHTMMAAISAKPPLEQPLAELVASCHPDELVKLAVDQGVAGRALERLGPLLPGEARARLQTRVREDVMRHLRFLGVLELFANALEDVDVPWVVLKGPVLAELSYKNTVRGYSDLDLMVPARQLRRAVNALEGARAELADRDWPLLVKQGKGELTMAYGGSPMLDLHWHLVGESRARQRYTLCADEVMERRRRVTLGTVKAWALEPTDFATHVALHASFSGTHRLRWLLDIERTVKNQTPDWDVLIERCHAWKVGLPVSVALNRARETVGALVPEEVVTELSGGNLQQFVVRQLSSWSPSGRMPGGRSVKNGVARSLRDSLLATTTQFVEETWETLGGLLHPKQRGRVGPGGLSEPPSTAVGFDHFIEMAASADRYGHLSKRKTVNLTAQR